MRSKNTDIDKNKRTFLSRSLIGAAGLSLRSLATGLPTGFLFGGAMPSRAQQASEPKSLIMAMSDDGESINSYTPGTYSSNSSDARFNVERASPAELGNTGYGSINGNTVTADDFSESSTYLLGENQVTSARFLSFLPDDLKERLAYFHIRTAANGHPEGGRVHGINSALVAENGRGTEEIQSAIMQELTLAYPGTLGILNSPVVLNGGGGRLATLKYRGATITRYSPLDIKDLFLTENTAEIENMARVYNNAIDEIYAELKQTGTPAQIRYLDDHALSRSQAVDLGNNLGDLLSNISSDSRGDQHKAAVSLIRANLAPVVVVRYATSKDNHNDEFLSEEVELTIEHMNAIEGLWSLLKDQGMEDQVNYATLDVFGRTFGRNTQGGRDHHNSSSTNIVFGSNIRAGQIGGVEEWPNSGHRLLSSTGINSTTGSSTNPDISIDESLAAYAKTLMASVGIPDERIQFRIPSSKIIHGALLS